MRTMNLTLALIIVALVVTIFSLSSPVEAPGPTDPAGPTASIGHHEDDATRSPAAASAFTTDPATDTGTTDTGTADTNKADINTADTSQAETEQAKPVLGHYAEPNGTDVDRRGAAALARISYPWQQMLPGWEIQFHEARSGAYGYTLTREHHIDIYVRDKQSEQLLAHVVAHEIGHAIDVTLNDSDDRRRWEERRNIGTAPWWPDNRASDFATGAGDFAESFAAWQVGTAAFRSEIATPPSTSDLELMAELAQS